MTLQVMSRASIADLSPCRCLNANFADALEQVLIEYQRQFNKQSTSRMRMRVLGRFSGCCLCRSFFVVINWLMLRLLRHSVNFQDFTIDTYNS